MACDTLAAMFRALSTLRARAVHGIGAAISSALCALTCSAPSFAHVALDSPESGVTLAVGSTVVITWEDTILHEGLGYDLDLVDVTRGAALSPIEHGLPTSQHRYDWLVPDVLCVGCYLVVAQDNVDHDYFDSVLVNIYGKPAAVAGSGGTGGSPQSQGGTNSMPAGTGGGSSGRDSSSGSGGTLPALPVGSAGGSVAMEFGAGGTIEEGNGGAAGAEPEPPMQAPTSTAAGADGDAASADAGQSADSTPDSEKGSPPSDGCAIGRRAPSHFALNFTVVALAIALAARKRRALRPHG